MPTNVHTDSTDLKLDKVKIKFVGPAVRKGLAKGGIQTVTDLAGSSVDEIESILENAGLPTPTRTAEKIEEMIQEAKISAATQPNSDAQTDSIAAASQLAPIPEFTVFFNYGYIEDDQQQRWRALIHPHNDGSKPEPPKWHLSPNDEGYTVRFEHQSSENSQNSWRTIIYNGKSSEETDITGWTPDKWWPWIMERASLTEEALQVIVQGEADIESMPTSVSEKSVVAAESQAEKALSITRFEVHLPSDKRANILVADVDFEISEELLAQRPPQFQVELLYVSLENNVSHVAGYDSKQLDLERRKYESQIEFDMPELGEHMLHCVVLLPSGELGDYQKHDIITVNPKSKKKDVEQ